MFVFNLQLVKSEYSIARVACNG
eukprot:SAG31_NODE_22799_length_517_cov_1.349282_1_plen_22_part_10